MSNPSPSNQPVPPTDAGAQDAGTPLDEGRLDGVVGGTLRVTVRPVLLQTPDYAPLPDDTRHTLDPAMPPVDP